MKQDKTELFERMPVGKALLGRKVGDRVEVEVNPSLKYTVEIRGLEKGEDDESLDISTY